MHLALEFAWETRGIWLTEGAVLGLNSFGTGDKVHPKLAKRGVISFQYYAYY